MAATQGLVKSSHLCLQSKGHGRAEGVVSVGGAEGVVSVDRAEGMVSEDRARP